MACWRENQKQTKKRIAAVDHLDTPKLESSPKSHIPELIRAMDTTIDLAAANRTSTIGGAMKKRGTNSETKIRCHPLA
jgi:hypothetical protein